MSIRTNVGSSARPGPSAAQRARVPAAAQARPAATPQRTPLRTAAATATSRRTRPGRHSAVPLYVFFLNPS